MSYPVTEMGGVKKRTAETVFGDRDFAPRPSGESGSLRETVKIAGWPPPLFERHDGSKAHIFLIASKDKLILYVCTTEYGSRLTKVFGDS